VRTLRFGVPDVRSIKAVEEVEKGQKGQKGNVHLLVQTSRARLILQAVRILSRWELGVTAGH
jgi:hypothetical protein